MSGHRKWRDIRHKKEKDMAPQQTDTVELPDLVEPTVQEDGGWIFPDNWSDEDKRDWLVTHPVGVETVTIADGPEPDSDIKDQIRADFEALDDEAEEASEREVISALKADGYYAAAIAVPPDQQDTVNSDNYDPRQFFLVHAEVWNEFVSAVHQEAELGLENKELRKRVNALTRGMRKVNRHWSFTKRQLKHANKAREENMVWWAQHDLDQLKAHTEELKRKDIFATRLARRLRKARAGRDKRERQLTNANLALKAQDHIIAKQDSYIKHLESLLTGDQMTSKRV